MNRRRRILQQDQLIDGPKYPSGSPSPAVLRIQMHCGRLKPRRVKEWSINCIEYQYQQQRRVIEYKVMNEENNKLAHMAIFQVPLWGWERIIRSLLFSVGVSLLSKRVHIIMVIGHAEQTKIWIV
jgi:hypothetical protein